MSRPRGGGTGRAGAGPVFVFLLGAALGGTLRAQEGTPVDPSAWASVVRLAGSATLVNQGWVNEGGETPSDERASTHETTVRFELTRDDTHGTADFLWRASRATVRGSLDEAATFRGGDVEGTTRVSAEYQDEPRERIYLHVSSTDGRWELSTPAFTKGKYARRVVHRGRRMANLRWVDDSSDDTYEDDRIESMTFAGTVTTSPQPLTGLVEIRDTVEGKPKRGGLRVGRLHLWPAFEDVELKVEIEGYADWRPKGSIAEPARPGGSLAVRAKLHKPGGGDGVWPRVKRFRFALADTSREPGVCMNWPLGATDEDYDLRLEADPGCPGEAEFGGQKLEVAPGLQDETGRPYALAAVESFDFGGRATLTVHCDLEDGRTLVGELEAAGEVPRQDLIRLPFMKAAGWIAEAWRKEEKLGTLHEIDDEEEVEGQQYRGDGFTLWEEYRGFAVAGRHVEGDPRKKDFFVLNRIGADGRTGIKLFETASQLRVHARLRPTEMDVKKRRMNGNRKEGPQRIAQHGVWVKAFPTVRELGLNGACTPVTVRGVAARPAITVGVGILAKSVEDSTFHKPYRLRARDMVFAFDRAVAHELLHSVGVDHHGEGNTGRFLHFEHANSPDNAQRRVRLVWGEPPQMWELERFHDGNLGQWGKSGDSTATRVREEGTGRDMAEALAPEAEREFTRIRASEMEPLRKAAAELVAKYPKTGHDAFYWAEKQAHEILSRRIGLDLDIGIPGGEDSGAQDCLMRYYFSNSYPVRGEDHSFWLIPAGTNKIGFEVCRSPLGTGINAAGRSPQSRHGDAKPGYGDCFSWICPNDAIPPRRLP